MCGTFNPCKFFGNILSLGIVKETRLEFKFNPYSIEIYMFFLHIGLQILNLSIKIFIQYK
jgi:hypothetical protein